MGERWREMEHATVAAGLHACTREHACDRAPRVECVPVRLFVRARAHACFPAALEDLLSHASVAAAAATTTTAELRADQAREEGSGAGGGEGEAAEAAEASGLATPFLTRLSSGECLVVPAGWFVLLCRESVALATDAWILEAAAACKGASLRPTLMHLRSTNGAHAYAKFLRTHNKRQRLAQGGDCGEGGGGQGGDGRGRSVLPACERGGW